MNIPTIEELDRIGSEAVGLPKGLLQGTLIYAYLTAVRDAVVAACRPQLRPIAEMPAEVPAGCVRVFGRSHGNIGELQDHEDTHFIDIALPVEAYPDDFESAFAESKLDAKDKDAAFKLWRGGAR